MAKYVSEANLRRFWGNIQDQIGSASQEQVDAWLNEHPEATTTVQDGAISTVKLADGAVTDAKLAHSSVVNPINWCDHDAMTSGILNANGTVTEASNRAYTEFIPVTAGDVVRAYYNTNGMYMTNICAYDADRQVLSGEGRDSSGMTFTVGSNTKFVRVTFDSSYIARAMVTVNTVPTSYEQYFEPYCVLTKDYLTEQSQALINAISNRELDSTYLSNRYGCALPRTTCRQTIGLAQSWYRSSIATPSTTFIYATVGSDYCTLSSDAVTFPNTTPIDSTIGYRFEFYDSMYADIEMGGLEYSQWGWPRHFVAENLSDCSMLVIGDSTVDQGDYITANLLSHFDSQGHTLTLLGTLGTGSNRNEGRAGWRATDYLTDKSYEGTVNPFYNPATQTFDFAYYMTNQGYSSPDFVVVQLGINDLYTGNDASIATTWNAIKTIVDSIVSYADGIKVILNLPTAPNSNQSMHSANAIFLPSLINRIVRYNEYATKKVLELYSESRVRTSYCHLILDPANDIYDTVHPKQAGYEKMALEIVNQVNCWLN